MEKYVVVNIGCIECGVSSNIVGVYSQKEKAQQVAQGLQADKGYNWRQGGQNSYEVFTLPKLDSTNPEYNR